MRIDAELVAKFRVRLLNDRTNWMIASAAKYDHVAIFQDSLLHFSIVHKDSVDTTIVSHFPMTMEVQKEGMDSRDHSRRSGAIQMPKLM